MAASGAPANSLTPAPRAPNEEPIITSPPVADVRPSVPDRISLRAEFEDSGTVDARFSGAPHGDDGSAANASTYFRTYMGGVTD